MTALAKRLRGFQGRTWSLRREWVLLILLIGLVIWMSQLSSNFLNSSNLLDMSRFSVEAGLIALPMTWIIITGGIDLSVGSILALSSVAIGFTYQAGLPLPLAILCGLLVGVACGLVNGLLITILDLHPLAITLGTFALFRGIAYAWTNGASVSVFPHWFKYFGQYYFESIPGQLIAFGVAIVIFAIVLARTRLGRYIYAIGSNERAAAFSAVDVARMKVLVYAATGLMVGIAAIIYTSRVSTARANAGQGLELEVITAVVLGGASIYGGSGTIVGTVLGVFMLAVLKNGLFLGGVDSNWILVIVGAVLIAGVFLNEVFRKSET
jgi:ribose/xylose/arabinose/galactoside ABC-type transport system permease subunit